jgi:NAD(P)-dependent dehydrogenase (short-subunit alcohol dehydrogenase family)
MSIYTKKVLVVGGSRGIGKGVTEAFQSLGYDTYYFSRSKKEDNRIPSIRPFHYSTHIPVNIKNESGIIRGFEEFDKKEGKLDILVNVAGINYCKNHEDISSCEWDEVLDTNLRSFFLTIKEAVKRMKYGSKIVNVSSIAGRSKSIVSGVHYTASKSGIIGLTRQFAQELGPKGININCVCPSQTLTDMLQQSMREEQIQELERTIPLKRLATVTEIVDPILFLCSNKSNYIHGACLDINGGQF